MMEEAEPRENGKREKWQAAQTLKERSLNDGLKQKSGSDHGGKDDIDSFLIQSFQRVLLLPSHFSHIRLCVAAQTAAHQVLLSLGFSRQEYWSGLPFPSPVRACLLSRFSRDSMRPYGQQPTRLLCPWDSLGKNIGVGCRFLFSFREQHSFNKYLSSVP